MSLHLVKLHTTTDLPGNYDCNLGMFYGVVVKDDMRSRGTHVIRNVTLDIISQSRDYQIT